MPSPTRASGSAEMTDYPSRPLAPRRRPPAWLTVPMALGIVAVAFWFAVALPLAWWSPSDPLTLAGRPLRPAPPPHSPGTAPPASTHAAPVSDARVLTPTF